MTCIIGYIDRATGDVYLGSDSAATSDDGEFVRIKTHKVFRRGEYGFGATSSLRTLQIIHHCLQPPTIPRAISSAGVERFLVERLIPAISETITKHTGTDTRAEVDAQMIVAVRGKLFYIDTDFCITEISNSDYIALGTGGNVALGALHALEGYQLTPRTRIKNALEAACRFNCRCAPPFRIIKIANN